MFWPCGRPTKRADPPQRWGSESGGFLGTILFLSLSLKRTQTDLVYLPGHCHRAAVSVEASFDTRPVPIMSTHLLLSQPLRVIQMRTIGQYLRRRPSMQTILLGDINEWRFCSGLILNRKLVGTVLYGPVCRTFPSIWPLFAARPYPDRPTEQCTVIANRNIGRDGACLGPSAAEGRSHSFVMWLHRPCGRRLSKVSNAAHRPK